MSRAAFFSVSPASLLSKFVGESEKVARALFGCARARAPAVVFFDEVDALLAKRGGASEHEASRRLKTELLTQMDGVPTAGAGGGGAPRVLTLATSNRPWDLDDAMRRRLERRIYVPPPDAPFQPPLAQSWNGKARPADGSIFHIPLPGMTSFREPTWWHADKAVSIGVTNPLPSATEPPLTSPYTAERGAWRKRRTLRRALKKTSGVPGASE